MARPETNGPKDSTATIGFEAKLWLAADKLRNHMDAAENSRAERDRLPMAARRADAGASVTDDEIAFYDALAANDSAVPAMGDAKLKVTAAELITQVKKSVTIYWTLRETAEAKKSKSW